MNGSDARTPSLGWQAVLLGLSWAVFGVESFQNRSEQQTIRSRQHTVPFGRLSVSTSNHQLSFGFVLSVWSPKHSTHLSTVFDRCECGREKCFEWETSFESGNENTLLIWSSKEFWRKTHHVFEQSWTDQLCISRRFEETRLTSLGTSDSLRNN